ncbi:MAG: hypothetical protein R3A52_15900 [Polyangiales bacterium]
MTWTRDEARLITPVSATRLLAVNGAVLGVARVRPQSARPQAPFVAASRDGERVAVGGYFGAPLVVWEASTGEVLTDLDPRSHGVRVVQGLGWADDGSLLVVNDATTVDARDPAGFALRGAIEIAVAPRWTVFASPDDRAVDRADARGVLGGVRPRYGVTPSAS